LDGASVPESGEHKKAEWSVRRESRSAWKPSGRRAGLAGRCWPAAGPAERGSVPGLLPSIFLEKEIKGERKEKKKRAGPQIRAA